MARFTFVGVCAAVLALTVGVWGADAAGPSEINSRQSVMTVHVLKSGMFSAFGHEHEISAPIQQGTLNEKERTVELTVDARKMMVMDKDVSEKDRAEIQETMLGPKVLDTEKFPEIRFRSTSVEVKSAGQWNVRGGLTLHGQTHPIKLEVQGQDGHYRGTAQLKQTDFGITPVSGGAGTVKVKDELRVEFEIVAKP